MTMFVQKFKILLEEEKRTVGGGKTDNTWICSSYSFRLKTKLLCAERKTRVYGGWPMQRL